MFEKTDDPWYNKNVSPSNFDLSVGSKFADALHMPPSEREGDRAYAVEGANGINDL